MTPPTYTSPAPGAAGPEHDLVSHRPATLERSFPATREAPRSARGSLDVFARTIDPEAFWVLRLLVTELVTNALQHGSPSDSSRITLRVHVFPGTIAAVVEDDGDGFGHAPTVPDETRVRGWGLHLVPELADRWGLELSPRTAVWFELERGRRTAA
jgi:anti-sigma regulatory factor (Ser/Thr protein kinase)